MAHMNLDEYLPLECAEDIDKLLDNIESRNAYFDDLAVGKVLLHIKKIRLQLYFKSKIDSLNQKLTQTSSRRPRFITKTPSGAPSIPNEANEAKETKEAPKPKRGGGKHKQRRRAAIQDDGFFISKLTLPECLASVDYADLLPLQSFASVSKLAVRVWASGIKLNASEYSTLLSNFEPFLLKQFFIEKMENLNERTKAYKKSDKKHKKFKKVKNKHESHSVYTSINLSMRPVSIPMGGLNKRY